MIKIAKKKEMRKRGAVRQIRSVVTKVLRRTHTKRQSRRAAKRAAPIIPVEFVFPLNEVPRDIWVHMARLDVLSLDDWVRFGHVSKRARQIVWEKLPWDAFINEPWMSRFKNHNNVASNVPSGGFHGSPFPCGCLTRSNNTPNMLTRIISALQNHMCGQCGRCVHNTHYPKHWFQRIGLYGIRCYDCFRSNYMKFTINVPWFINVIQKAQDSKYTPLIGLVHPIVTSIHAPSSIFLRVEVIDFYTGVFYARLVAKGYDKTWKFDLDCIAKSFANQYVTEMGSIARIKLGKLTYDAHLDRYVEYYVLYMAMGKILLK